MGKSPLLAALLCALVAAPALADGNSAVVAQERGTLRGAIAPVETWADVAPQTEVHAGDTLKTGLNSLADVVLPSGGHLVMGEDTVIRVADLDGLSARMLTGRMRVVAPPSGILSFQAGELTLRGTDAEAIIEREGARWRVGVISGTFAVTDADREALPVGPGKLLTLMGDRASVRALGRSEQDDLMAGLQFNSTTAATTSISEVARAAGPNRWLATGLSTVLPGTGQVYSGEWPRGLAYLGLDFALLGAGYYFHANNQPQNAAYAAYGLIGLNVLSPLDALIFTPSTKAAQ
ncbi:MAG TPA: hypothetical protein V6D47_15050 [Oscillatoriaceae cyanobacterium]